MNTPQALSLNPGSFHSGYTKPREPQLRFPIEQRALEPNAAFRRGREAFVKTPVESAGREEEARTAYPLRLEHLHHFLLLSSLKFIVGDLAVAVETKERRIEFGRREVDHFAGHGFFAVDVDDLFDHLIPARL